jgi:hypothetical protein
MRRPRIPSLLWWAAVLPALLAACGGPPRVVEEFHGYPWGSRASQIPEVALAGVSGSRDGLLLYTANVRFLGREALATFAFEEEEGGLVEGSYSLLLALPECDAEWDRITTALAGAFPGLPLVVEVPTRGEADRGVYASDCEFYVYNAHRLDWTATLVNPEPPGDGVVLRLDDVGRSARLTVLYRGRAPGPEGAG